MPERAVTEAELDAHAGGHRWRLTCRHPEQPSAVLVWLPALGVAARHYAPFAESLARRGIAVAVHEWRGNGTSTLRADRHHDWGYPQLLMEDVPASFGAVARAFPGVPMRLGGHSLGGQLAACSLGLQQQAAVPAYPMDALWLVASGAPYWRAFPARTRYALPLAYRFLPWLAERVGALPGRRIGFGGTEARTVIRDWARTALSGRYRIESLPVDIEAGMRRAAVPTTGVVFGHDWLAPRSSLDFLLGKLATAPSRVVELRSRELGVRADHFAWMKAPDAVVDALMGRVTGPA